MRQSKPSLHPERVSPTPAGYQQSRPASRQTRINSALASPAAKPSTVNEALPCCSSGHRHGPVDRPSNDAGSCQQSNLTDTMAFDDILVAFMLDKADIEDLRGSRTSDKDENSAWHREVVGVWEMQKYG